MKIAMLGWEFPPFVAGGLGVHCYHLTRALARAGVDVDFYMPAVAGEPSPAVAPRHTHLRIHEVDADPGMDPYESDFNTSVMKYNAQLVNAFSSHDADVLHCHDWITLPAALELRQRTGLPLVFTVHSTEHDRSAGMWPQAWVADLEREGVRTADRVIAVSRYTQAALERDYGAEPAKTVAIHNGIDPAEFNGTGSSPNNGSGTVLFLSRLSRQKGPLYFLAAARKVLEVRPETGFVIAGRGEMLEECIQFTLRHGIAARVRFTGYVPAGELADTYRRNQVYVLPSVSEPFGISALEAMASGVPTIISRTSGVAEAVNHVLKVDHDDVEQMAEMILHVLRSPALHAELSRNGGHEVHRFDWDTCARKTIEVYQQLRPLEATL